MQLCCEIYNTVLFLQVEDPNKKRNIVKAFGSKPTALSKLSLKKKIEKGTLQKKIELVKKNKKIARERKKKSKNARQTFDKNLWGQGCKLQVFFIA